MWEKTETITTFSPFLKWPKEWDYIIFDKPSAHTHSLSLSVHLHHITFRFSGKVSNHII